MLGKSDTTGVFGSKKAARELPSKTIAKNCASLITYPHSERMRFENAPTDELKLKFCENFLDARRVLSRA